MKCPHCHIPLLMTERKGVEIDYCGQCRGVWLDKGELDKIIDLSVEERSGLAGVRRGDHHYDHKPRYESKDHKFRGHADRYHQQPYYKRKKKKSMLDDLFDFF
ncbi:MAG: hypothetical protein CMF25_02705 [Kangiellaceae bacterium]|nr:hypothetical protein [Kangiellaceae bacterium]